MYSTIETSSTRREYRIRTWQRVALCLLGGFFIATGLLLAGLSAFNSSGTPTLPMAVVFVAIAFYPVLYALQSRLVLDGTRISVRGAFQERSADRSEIEGYRTISNRNGPYLKLYLKQGGGSISVTKSFDTDEDYRAWLQQVPDLDEIDKNALLNEIRQDTELGSSPEKRLDALKMAKFWAIALTVIAVAGAAGLNFADRGDFLPCYAAMVLSSLAGLVLVMRSPLLYAVLKPKKDPRAQVSFVLFASGIGFIMRMRQIEFVSISSLWPIMALVLVGIGGGYLLSMRKNAVPGTLIALLLFAGLYSYGSVAVADTTFDNSKATVYTVEVTGKHVSHGKSTSYYLHLAPWGPVQQAQHIRVSRRIVNACY